MRSVREPRAPYLLAALAAVPGHRAVSQECLEWDPGFFSNHAGQLIEDAAVWDDGRGPSLYFAGRFETVGGQTSPLVGRYNGSRWEPVGGGLDNSSNQFVANAVEVHDLGNGPQLYVGGFFPGSASDVPGGVLRWDGGAWHSVGDPDAIDGEIQVLRSVMLGGEQALLAGGVFSNLGTRVRTGQIGVFRDGQWSAASAAIMTSSPETWTLDVIDWQDEQVIVAGGDYGVRFIRDGVVLDPGDDPDLNLDGTVIDSVIFNGSLYVTGGFSETVGGTPLPSGTARWAGDAWEAVGVLPRAAVNAITVWNDGSGRALYAAGSRSPDTGGEGFFFRFENGEWAPVSRQPDDAFTGLIPFPDAGGAKLYLYGGSLDSVNGVRADGLVSWDGEAFDPELRAAPNNRFLDLAVIEAGDAAGVYAARSGVWRWDGEAWHGLGEFRLNRVGAFDLGSGPVLFAGGDFDRSDGIAARGVARLGPGKTWQSLSGGINGEVEGFERWPRSGGADLIAFGGFESAGGIRSSFVAGFDGESWSDFGGGFDGPTITADTVVIDGEPRLFVSVDIDFLSGDDVAGGNLWDGESWTAIPQGFVREGGEYELYDLEVFDFGSGEELVLAGDFILPGDPPFSRHIARFDGVSWNSLGGGVGPNGQVNEIAVFDDGSGPKLYIAGYFNSLDGDSSIEAVACWDGNAWVGTGVTDGGGSAMQVADLGDGPRLIVSGLESAGGQALGGVGVWDGSSWSPLGNTGDLTSTFVYAMTVHEGGTGPEVFVSGFNLSAGGSALVDTARWSAAGWEAVGISEDPSRDRVRGMVSVDLPTGPRVYAAGDFRDVAGSPSLGLAVWDGTGWTSVEGLDGSVRDVGAFETPAGPTLVLTGGVRGVGATPVNGIARWDGADWRGLDGPPGTRVVLAELDESGPTPVLYAVARERVGGVSTDRIWSWDGHAWSLTPHEFNEILNGLLAADLGDGPALYVSGRFTTVNGEPVSNVISIRDSVVSSLGAGLDAVATGELILHDDGNGERLYAIGFAPDEDPSAQRVAKWDGTEWVSLGEHGVDGGAAEALASWSDPVSGGFFVAGDFQTAGSLSSRAFARWVSCDEACSVADIARPFGILDLRDINLFIGSFLGNESPADLSEPFGVFDLADIVVFVDAMTAGCPGGSSSDRE